jgi:hypothetical protein
MFRHIRDPRVSVQQMQTALVVRKLGHSLETPMKLHHLTRQARIAAAIAPLLFPLIGLANNPAFPGAEGYGGTFTGTAPAGGFFSTASVYHVTTTADLLDGNGKPVFGTLRGSAYDYTNPNSIKQQASNRIVVFDVGGTFKLTNGSFDIKTVSNIYYAGQSAPSPVTVYGDTTQITHSNNTVNQNVILRYMTFRRGVATAGNTDALSFAGGSNDGTGSAGTNMIVDHVSTSWATDEDVSVGNVNTNISVQYSIIADSLRTNHAYGSLVRPRSNSNVSYTHNLYANNLSRQPRPGTYNNNTLNFDFTNNVIANWKDRAGYSGGSSEPEIEHVNLNYVGNYLVAGPSTSSSASSVAFTMDAGGENPPDLHIYQSGNAIDSDRTANAGGVPNGSDTGWNMFRYSNGSSLSAFPEANKWAQPIGGAGNVGAPANTVAAPAFTVQSAADAYTQVINYAGNFWWARDGIDTRIINNVKNVTNPANGVAADNPDAAELALVLNAPTVTRAAGFDSDNDGMPNAWETAMGLNPSLASDGKLDFDTDGYTNVEEYLNELGAFPAPLPIQFTGATNARYAQISNWNIPFQPSRFDTVLINAGTANVDAIGQDAGSIVIGTIADQSPTLAINSGWLNVRQNLTIGAASGGTSKLQLAGGKLIVSGTIGGGAAGTDNVFAFTGGTLVTAGVDATNLRATTGGAVGTFRQNGATSVLSPGDSSIAGRIMVLGSYALDAGTLAIDLGSATAATTYQSATPAFDNVVASGSIALNGGTLVLTRIGGYDPATLVDHQIMGASTVTGHFATVAGIPVTASKWLAVTYDATGVHVTATTPGDSDVDGDVDFQDLVSLAQSYEATGQTWRNGDFTGDGTVGFADLVALAQFYGSGTGGLVGESTFASDWALAQSLVPEPTTLAGIGAMATLLVRRVRCRA